MTTNMIPSQGALVSRAAAVIALGLGAVFNTGCSQEPLCPELGDCGGTMPVGNWELSPGHPSCMEDLYVAATDTRLLGGEITPARQPTIEPALWDWCSLLLTGAGAGTDVQLKPPRFYYESGQVGTSQVTYTPDDPAHPDTGHVTVAITKTGRFTLDFPAMCVRAFGATDQPDPTIDPTGAVVPVCKRLQQTVGKSGLGEGSYPNTVCNPNPADPLGCLCSFDVTETGGLSGAYRKQGNVIIHYPSGNYPSKATFCHQGNRLQLTGTDGAYLFNVSGLRTMDLGVAAAPAMAP